MEVFTLLLFSAILLICIILKISIIYALLSGLLIFCIYGKMKEYSYRDLAKMILSGIKTAKSILIVFVLIGMLTALWRAGGTIPVIISYAVRLIRPSTIVLMSFLLNCGVSMLTGTAFGTAATMGVICMTMAVSMGTDPVFVGGAILSGVFFGDRCSPVSTSALLVSELTDTDIFDNIKKMLHTALVPFLLASFIYAAVGLFSNNIGNPVDLNQLLSREINLHWSAIIPAIIILVLSGFHVNVKIAMSVSIVASVFICLFVQEMDIMDVIRVAIRGFSARDQEVAVMLNGGGILSMLKVMAIITISSSYAGIFKKTGLLNHIKELLIKLSAKITPFGGMLVTSVVASMVACNQTLAIMLTHQLCKDIEPDPKKLAIYLENSVVVIAPLIPWSIAGAVPLASVGAPTSSILVAFFLYLLPICYLLYNLYSGRYKIKHKEA
jgi:NhaC family Na+:H+ antiporter